MKVTKKLLSVLLAVIMIVSSMSVCFGVVSFAGSATATQYQALADALTTDGVKNASYTVSGTAATFTDTTGDVMKAVQAWNDCFDAICDEVTNDYGNAYRTSAKINEAIKTNVQNYMTATEYTSYNCATILDAFVANTNPTYNKTKSVWSQYDAVSFTLTVNLDKTAYLKTFDSVAEIPASFVTKAVYSVTNKEYTVSAGRIQKYYFLAIGSGDKSENLTTDSTTKSSLTGWNSTLSSYASYFNADDVEDILTISKDETTLTSAKTAINNTYDAVVDAYGADIYSHFFSSYDVAATSKLIDDAVAFLGFESTVTTIENLCAKDYSSYTTAQLLEHKTALETAYASFKELEQATQDLIVKVYGLDTAATEAKITEVDKAWQVSAIKDYKVTSDAHINSYSSWNIDDVDAGTVTSAMITEAVATVSTDITTLGGYTPAYVTEVCGASYMTDLATLKATLEELGVAAGYNEEFLAEYNKFASQIKNITTTDYADLYTSLKNYDNWYTGLKALINEMRDELGDDIADKLFDDLNSLMVEHMDNAYLTLNTRTEVQINIAYDIYEAHKSAYGATVHFVSLESYNNLKQSIGLIDHASYLFLKSSGNFTVPAETVTKYDALQNMLVEYDKFVATKGFATYQQMYMDDFVREDTADDVARENTDKDSDGIGEYVTTDAEIEKIIKVLDTALTDDDVSALLGFDLGTMLNDLVGNAIVSDSFINTVVGMLYPLVAKEFIGAFGDLPQKSGDYDVIYSKGLHTVVKEEHFEFFPDLLATQLDATKYADTIALLNAAHTEFCETYPDRPNATGDVYYTLNEDKKCEKTAWDSSVLYDENGKLKLTWGVDAAKAEGKSDAEVKEIFYQAFDDAMQGLKPLLLAIIANKSWDGKIVTGFAEAWGNLIGYMKVANITLQLFTTANSGYANMLVPVYEAFGVDYTDVDTVENVYTTYENDVAAIIKAILEPIFALVDEIGNKPLSTVISILPNLCYVLSAEMVTPLLSKLYTNVKYYADITTIVGSLYEVEDLEDTIPVDVGEMLDLADMGIDLSDGINTLLKGFGIELPRINQELVATLGELTTIDTQRKEAVYGGAPAGKAYHVVANKADVLSYILEYLFTNLDEETLNSLLEAFAKEDEGTTEGETTTEGEATEEEKPNLIAEILANTSKNPEATVAAIVELLNQKEYETLVNYVWYDNATYEVGEIEGFNPATEIYLTPENDWTEEKAQYLYDNLVDVVNSVLTMTSKDGTEGDVNAMLTTAVNNVFSDKTLTSLAKTLGGIELDEKLNTLLVNKLGVDLSSYAQYAGLAEGEVYPFGVTDAASFKTALYDLLKPLSPVLDFILAGKDITVFDGTEGEVTLIGYNGYNDAVIPLLEALGCDVAVLAADADALDTFLTAIFGKIEEILEDPIYNIIDLLPGVLYFLSSDALTVTVRNLLQPVYVILDTIRPIYDIDLNELLATLTGDITIDLNNLDTNFVIDLVSDITGLNLTGLKTVIADVCEFIGTEYASVSTLKDQTTWKKGAYNASFGEADMLTVVLSYLLEWVSVRENAEALDILLKTDGIMVALNVVFSSVEIKYSTPNWMYWFETEEEFNSYVNGNTELPDTLLALTYPNDWSDETAQYIADNLATLVDMVIGLIEIDGVKYESLAALLDAKVNVFTTENLNKIVELVTGLLENVDENLIDLAGVLLDVNLTGLKSYTAPEGITTADAFAAELAKVLTTYADGLMNWLFFGDDYRFAKKSDNTDSIVINGGLGYEKGLALILEALGCELPAEATVETVLASLADRIDYILTDGNTVNEVIDLLPNLVYFLNADGASVAVDNLLQPVYALLTKLEELGIEVDLTELLGFDLKYLSLEDILALVETKTGLDLTAAEEILVDLCIGKISKGTYTYKMTADRKDTITVVLTTALLLVEDEEFAAKLDEMLGTDIIAALKTVFESAPVSYVSPNWDYCWDENDVDYVYGTIGVIDSALNYPNDWTEETAKYVTENLPYFADLIVSLIEIDGVKYESLDALIEAKADIYTEDVLAAIQKAISDLIGGLDEDLKELVNVALGAADSLLGADVEGLINYDISGVNDKESFIEALTGMLMEVEGLVDWLLLGEDYEFFVDDDGDMVYEEGEAIITLNGGHGYAEGLALVLEALGCENLPTVYDKQAIDTEATVKAVLTSLANRIDEVLANPVDEVIDLLPNLIYFLNANGVAAAVDNLIGAINALIIKLDGVGVELNINDLVNIKKLMKIEDTDATISLDNLAMKDILQAVSYMTGLDLTVLEDVLVGFALGDVQAYESVSRTYTTFKMQYETEFDRYDMVTVLATSLLLVVKTEGNAAKLEEMLGTDVITTVLGIIDGKTVNYATPDWDYCDTVTDNDTIDVVNYAITYPNNWTEASAEYVADNLKEFGDMIATLVDKNYTSLGALATDKVKLYTGENIQAIVDAVNGLLKDVDGKLLTAAGLLLGADLEGLASYKAPAGEMTGEQFATELADVLTTYAGGVVEWLLLGHNYEFFVDFDANEDGKYEEDIITISGGHGYAEGLALLLEAIGCENLPDAYTTTASTEEIVKAVILSLTNRIDAILADPVTEFVDVLPNVLYFLNANGVAAVIDNMLASVFALLDELKALGVELDINELVNIKDILKIEQDVAISVDNLTLAAILEVVEIKTGLELTEVEDVLANFALGEVKEYDSISRNAAAYKMGYKDEFDKHDMVTVLATLVIITAQNENNADVLKELLGEDVYSVILNMFNMAEVPVEEMDWILTEYADTDHVFSALETTTLDGGFKYGPLYTEDMEEYIADNFGTFVDNIIYLLGVEIDGVSVSSLTELLNGLLNGSLYNSENVVAIRDALADIIANLDNLEVNGAKVGGHIKAILNAAELADLDAVAKVEVAEFSNDRVQFVNALCDVLEPLYPVLRWLLVNEDLTFFVNAEKEDAITLKGGEGYAYGIIHLLEALDCQNVLKTNDYYATVKADPDALLTAILNPVLDRAEVIIQNPAEEILSILPNLVYFINSNGVDTVVKNTLNAVYTLLSAIEPIAKIDLYEIIGIDLSELTFDKLLEMALDMIEESTGYHLDSFSADSVDELTVGKLVSYTSANGETAYRMVYQSEEAKGEMVTVILRLLIIFVAHENNQEAVMGILTDTFSMDEGTQEYVAALLKAVCNIVTDTHLGMDAALAVIYYVFYGLEKGVGGTAGGMKDANALWFDIFKGLFDTNDPNKAQIGKILIDILGGDIFDGILDPDEGVAPNGIFAFFQKIMDWFRKIIEWFKNLFK